MTARALWRPVALPIAHGADDATPGTRPLHATQPFQVVRGKGGTARRVMRPFEPHGYSALESNEQLACERVNGFDRHVKQAPPRAAPPAFEPGRQGTR